MARTILAIGTVAWTGTGVGGLLAGTVAPDRVAGMLPALTIGADAVGGAVTAISVALVAIGAAHAALLAALRNAGPWPRSAGILLCGVVAAGFVVLGVACLTAAATEPAVWPSLTGAAAASLAVSIGYAVAGRRLVAELRSDPPPEGPMGL